MGSGPVFAMFPGQGSQYVGMAKGLLEQFPSTAQTFEEAEDQLKIDLRKLCLEGPEDQLKLTANTQPCLLTMSVATWRALRSEIDLQPALFAGHSLGEYSALVAAGVVDFSRAVELVRQRGLAMQQAVPPGVGAMAAVMSPDEEMVMEVCRGISQPDAVVEVVNFNSPQQRVIAGHATAVNQATTALKERGANTIPLPVSAPFHSTLMASARQAMEPLLRDTEFRAPTAPIIANVSGETISGYSAEMLIEQIDHPVRWTQSLGQVEKSDCQCAIEVGPGRVLNGLAKRTFARGRMTLVSTDDPSKGIQDLKGFLD